MFIIYMSTGPYNNIGSSRYCGKEKPCTTKGQPKSTGKIGKNNLGNAQQDIIHLSPFHFLLAYIKEKIIIGKGASFAMHLILMSKFHIKRQGTKRQRTRQCQSLSLLGQDMKTSRKHDNLFKFVFFVARL